MKSFKQFLSEEEARQGKLLTNKGTAQDFRNPKKIPFTGTDPTPTQSSSGSPEESKVPKVSPGQMEIPSGKPPKGTKTKVSGSKVRGAATDPWKQFPKKPKQQLGMPKTGPSSSLPGRTLAPAGGTTARPALPAAGETGRTPAQLNQIATERQARRAAEQAAKEAKKVKGGALALRPQGSSSIVPSGASSAAKEAEKAAAKTATKTAGKGILKTLGRVAGPASAALDVADEKSKGSGWVRSLAKGAAVAAGGALGGAAGSAVAPGAGTVAGAVG